MTKEDALVRCEWCSGNDLYTQYHDKEWGVPLYDDNKLFELLTLEGAQAGLSWLTILKKRNGYRKAFDNFNPNKVAQYDDKKIQALFNDSDIVRNKLKIVSVIKNAKVILDIQKEFGSFNDYIWRFVKNTPLQHNYSTSTEMPPTNSASLLMSKDLRKRGMNFVGPTICYAFMQASGMINDHLKKCFRHQQLTSTALPSRNNAV